MRYRLRTLLIVMAVGPPLVAGICVAICWLWCGEFPPGTLFVAGAIAWYALFAFGLGFLIAWAISAANGFISRLQGRR